MANVSKACIAAETLERDSEFDLHQYAKLSFGA